MKSRDEKITSYEKADQDEAFHIWLMSSGSKNHKSNDTIQNSNIENVIQPRNSTTFGTKSTVNNNTNNSHEMELWQNANVDKNHLHNELFNDIESSSIEKNQKLLDKQPNKSNYVQQLQQKSTENQIESWQAKPERQVDVKRLQMQQQQSIIPEADLILKPSTSLSTNNNETNVVTAKNAAVTIAAEKLNSSTSSYYLDTHNTNITVTSTSTSTSIMTSSVITPEPQCIVMGKY